MLTVRRGRPADLPAALALFAGARQFMAQSGNPNQWGQEYPPPSLVKQELKAGVCWIVEQRGTAVGVFSCLPGPDPTYAVITGGTWPDDAPYFVIHRLAAAAGVHGIAQACFAWCFAQGRALRVDTHADNRPMQHVLEKNGFVHCGQILCHNGTPRLAYWHAAACAAVPAEKPQTAEAPERADRAERADKR